MESQPIEDTNVPIIKKKKAARGGLPGIKA
jgi:hypothetical protein